MKSNCNFTLLVYFLSIGKVLANLYLSSFHRSHNSIMLYFLNIFCILLYIFSIFSVFLSILLVSVEYWQICIYPLRVAQWHSRARYLAQDGQLRSSSHQQFYKTQFIKNFWISQFLSYSGQIHLIFTKFTFDFRNCLDVKFSEKMLFAEAKYVITFSTMWFPPINCVKQTKVWQ